MSVRHPHRHKNIYPQVAVVIHYGECKSLSTVCDIIICMRSENILPHETRISSVQSLSRVRLFVTPMNHSTPGLPVHHQLPESIQTHVH